MKQQKNLEAIRQIEDDEQSNAALMGLIQHLDAQLLHHTCHFLLTKRQDDSCLDLDRHLAKMYEYFDQIQYLEDCIVMGTGIKK